MGYNQFYTLEEDGDVPVVNFDTWWVNDNTTVSVKSVNISWMSLCNVVNEGVRTTASLGQIAVLWYPIVTDIYMRNLRKHSPGNTFPKAIIWEETVILYHFGSFDFNVKKIFVKWHT